MGDDPEEPYWRVLRHLVEARGETADREYLVDDEWSLEEAESRFNFCPELKLGVHQRSDYEPNACRNCGALLRDD